MQANSIICSGTSRFLNDTYTTNLHTNSIDVTTGSNYSSSLTPYIWSIHSKREEPLLFLTQADSNGTITDQLIVEKNDIYAQCGWNGTSTSLQKAMEIVGNTVRQTALGSDGYIYPIIFSGGNDTGATTHTGSTNIDQYLHYTKSNNGHLYVGDVTQQSTTVGLTNVGHNSIIISAPKQTTSQYLTASPTDITLTGSTWDGTNTSLKTALGAKFNSAGGTISGAVSMSNNLTVSGSGSFNIGTVRTNSGAINFYRNPSQDVMTSAIQDTANGLEIMIPTSRSTNIRVISSTGYINLLTKYGVGVYNEVGDGYKGITASSFTKASSRIVKKNIKDITVTDAKKILDLRPCTFDFKVGNENNCAGMIAEEVMDVYPNLVSMPDNYDEEEAIEKTAKGELAQVPSLDYSKFVPYLIKMVQEQQKEIDELKAIINQ